MQQSEEPGRRRVARQSNWLPAKRGEAPGSSTTRCGFVTWTRRLVFAQQWRSSKAEGGDNREKQPRRRRDGLGKPQTRRIGGVCRRVQLG